VANELSGIFETLVIPAAVEAAESLKFTKATLGSIFWDYQSTHGSIGQTLNVNVPVVNQGDTVDIGSGPLQPSDTDHNTVAIVIADHPSVSFVIKSWDKVRTPVQLRTLYMQPKLESLLRYCDQLLTSQITASNFGVFSAHHSTITNEFGRADLASMWANLAQEGAPVYQREHMCFLTNPIAYSSMFADTSFFQAFVVGETAAEQAQQRALIVPQLNCTVKFDQQIGQTTSGQQLGLMFHRYAIAGLCVIPPSNTGVGPIEETYIRPVAEAPNFVVQVQAQYSIMEQGTVINMHAMLGTKVVRPEYGSFGFTL
jgi:hypothetical protein